MSVINSKKWTESELKSQGFNKIVVGVPGRPFPVMVPNPHAISTEDVYRLEVIEDAGHLPNIERPEEFNHIVLEFLAQHR